MSLEIAKLEKVRELAGGIVQARCPACAEGGNDRKGEHLRIYPDGKFGCCVHPKDSEHRKRIWALVGVRKPGTFSLRLKSPPALPAVRSVKAVLTAGTPRTVKTELETGVLTVPTTPVVELRTGRTTEVKLCARARGDCVPATIKSEDIQEQLKDSESAVRAALVSERLPFLTADGDLSIPFDSPERYHWWKPDGVRLSVVEILAEVKERMKNAAII
ncbi:MAG: hypothetical protein WCH99_20750 [Verrucomicrobiota bacterium]